MSKPGIYLGPDDEFPTLFELSKRACMRNVEGIDDVGHLPWRLVRPILLKLESPAKLRTIEENCPQIAGEDEELWISYIRRDFGIDAVTKYRPANKENWHKVYRKLKKEQAVKDAVDIEKLKADMAKMNEKREKRQATMINGVKRSDLGRLRMADKNTSRSNGGARYMAMNVMNPGRITKDPGARNRFKNPKLNSILTKGPRR